LLLVGFSRWRVERCFEDSKGEVGMDHYEGRRYVGLKRHLILSAVSYLFLVEAKQRLREKNPEWTVCQVQTATGALVESWWLNGRATKELLARAARKIARDQQRNALTREYHTKRTRQKLRILGIKLTTTPRCAWDTS